MKDEISHISDEIEDFLINKGFKRYEAGELAYEDNSYYIKGDTVVTVNILYGADPEVIREIQGLHEKMRRFKPGR
jgi:hypothetical protein